MHARLIDESGLVSPSTYLLDDSVVTQDNPATLGRYPTNCIVLRDRLASRRHARIYYHQGEWYLCDQAGITNPTLVNGEPVHGETRLQDGQLLSIGAIRLRFVVEGSQEVSTSSDLSAETSILPPLDLTLLLRFLEAARTESTTHRLVNLALQTMLQQTGADMVGYLGQPDDQHMRLVLPQDCSPNSSLSQRLNRLAHTRGQLIWLSQLKEVSTKGDSLDRICDAIIIPMRSLIHATGDAVDLGTLHAYTRKTVFNNAQVQFCRVLAANLATSLELSIRQRALRADHDRLRELAGNVIGHTLIGSSAAMSKLREQIRRVGNSTCSVLIRGETGVGKELVARALHHASARRDGPFVAVNCAAIVVELAESELFGHRKGAFSGANQDRAGAFSEADLGTLFLDEVGDLPAKVQTKLLRVMETKRFRPVGSEGEISTDVRILAATNRPLEQQMAQDNFRDDFYHRFQVELFVPPLRERLEDIPELATYLLWRLEREHNRQVQLSPAALQRLQTYDWPGNVRQLAVVLERALFNTDGPILEPEDLPLKPGRLPEDGPPSFKLAEVEAWAVRRVLQQTTWNKSAAAEVLGIDRSTLYKLIERYGIRPN